MLYILHKVLHTLTCLPHALGNPYISPSHRPRSCACLHSAVGEDRVCVCFVCPPRPPSQLGVAYACRQHGARAPCVRMRTRPCIVSACLGRCHEPERLLDSDPGHFVSPSIHCFPSIPCAGALPHCFHPHSRALPQRGSEPLLAVRSPGGMQPRALRRRVGGGRTLAAAPQPRALSGTGTLACH